ncbi:hypothetical protein TVAGG3_0368020, partial [Trichomonas vaginalis G3]|uniref:hypothetical protein n=1 Tax=Trichomonas vaginalis (strain ATCC PRA-98 / G3) TaxID=412133 RepID=UPI0021E59302
FFIYSQMTQSNPTDKTQGVIDVEALKKEIREQILSELKEQKQNKSQRDQRENLVKNN